MLIGRTSCILRWPNQNATKQPILLLSKYLTRLPSFSNGFWQRRVTSSHLKAKPSTPTPKLITTKICMSWYLKNQVVEEITYWSGITYLSILMVQNIWSFMNDKSKMWDLRMVLRELENAPKGEKTCLSILYRGFKRFKSDGTKWSNTFFHFWVYFLAVWSFQNTPKFLPRCDKTSELWLCQFKLNLVHFYTPFWFSTVYFIPLHLFSITSSEDQCLSDPLEAKTLLESWSSLQCIAGF